MYSETIPMEDPIEASSDSNIQRLWDYLTVKQLLDKTVQSSGKAKEKCGFVTHLTSMVVTKPQGEDSQVAHKPKEGEKPSGSRQGFSGSIFQFMSGHPGLPRLPAQPGPDYGGQSPTKGGVGLMLDAEEEHESYPAYKIVRPLMSLKLKIQDKEVAVSRSFAVDLSVRSASTVAC
ncbi:unnamed protein product, partial [Coregonus sp. 'balchen']